MKIGGGSLKGRRFAAPKGGKTVRPISERVKEALFDILAPKFQQQDLKVLDLFSGTGAIAFESISRGAFQVLCIEHDRRNIGLIQNNAISLGVTSQLKVMHGRLPETIKRIRGPFSVIFMDPPFALDIATELFPLIAKKKLLHDGGVIVLQRDRRSKQLESSDFEIKRSHRVGDSVLFFYGHHSPSAI